MDRQNACVQSVSKCLVVLSALFLGVVLLFAAFSHRHSGTRPTTVASVGMNGVRLARFFDGLPRVDRYSIDNLIRNRHPKPACSGRFAQLVEWIDSLMRVRTVHAQGS